MSRRMRRGQPGDDMFWKLIFGILGGTLILVAGAAVAMWSAMQGGMGAM